MSDIESPGETEEPKAYVMGSSDPELSRLIEQAHVFEPQSRALLQVVHLHRGMRALDLGCGPVGVLDLLAESVGTEGEVVGIDSDGGMVTKARAFAASSGLQQVKVVTGDAAHTALPSEHFDLVHARLLLLHVKDAGSVVREMVRLCRPGAVVALHDVDADPWFCEPPHPSWDRLAGAFIELLESRGTAANLGRRLYGMLFRAGLVDLGVTAFPELSRSTDPYREKLIDFVTIARGQLLERGLVSEPELGRLIDELRIHLAQAETIVLGGLHYQAWGRKPA